MSNQTNTEQTVHSLPGEERGMPSVNETGPSTAKRGLIVIVILLILCAAGGVGYWKYKKNAAKASGKHVAVISLQVGHHQMTETPDNTLFAIRDFLQAAPI